MYALRERDRVCVCVCVCGTFIWSCDGMGQVKMFHAAVMFLTFYVTALTLCSCFLLLCLCKYNISHIIFNLGCAHSWQNLSKLVYNLLIIMCMHCVCVCLCVCVCERERERERNIHLVLWWNGTSKDVSCCCDVFDFLCDISCALCCCACVCVVCFSPVFFVVLWWGWGGGSVRESVCVCVSGFCYFHMYSFEGGGGGGVSDFMFNKVGVVGF